MKAKNKVVYVPPVYEEVQHEFTSVDDNNNPLRTSFHTDVSLLQRIDNMRADAQTLREIKESLQPMVDTSNFRAQFEETFGSLTDDELINSSSVKEPKVSSNWERKLDESIIGCRDSLISRNVWASARILSIRCNKETSE